MDFLVCNNCKGYYQIQPGESPQDFDLTCTCGGKLEYKSINLDENKNSEEKLNNNHEYMPPIPKNFKRAYGMDMGNFSIILFILLAVIVSILYVIGRNVIFFYGL